MTNGEALERIKKDFYFDEEGLEKYSDSINCKYAIDLAKLAIKKQIPMPVVWSNTDYPRCPVCGHYVGVEAQEPYCSVCGQALDWEGEEDV